ncbi:MAG TPA: hypothetical protein VJB15_02105 [Rhodothermia bacterium]|nr:hypothetical protein [Rhodothermia bacterium]
MNIRQQIFWRLKLADSWPLPERRVTLHTAGDMGGTFYLCARVPGPSKECQIVEERLGLVARLLDGVPLLPHRHRFASFGFQLHHLPD